MGGAGIGKLPRARDKRFKYICFVCAVKLINLCFHWLICTSWSYQHCCCAVLFQSYGFLFLNFFVFISFSCFNLFLLVTLIFVLHLCWFFKWGIFSGWCCLTAALLQATFLTQDSKDWTEVKHLKLITTLDTICHSTCSGVTICHLTCTLGCYGHAHNESEICTVSKSSYLNDKHIVGYTWPQNTPIWALQKQWAAVFSVTSVKIWQKLKLLYQDSGYIVVVNKRN